MKQQKIDVVTMEWGILLILVLKAIKHMTILMFDHKNSRNTENE